MWRLTALLTLHMYQCIWIDAHFKLLLNKFAGRRINAAVLYFCIAFNIIKIKKGEVIPAGILHTGLYKNKMIYSNRCYTQKAKLELMNK